MSGWRFAGLFNSPPTQWWLGVCKQVNPDLTWEEYELLWDAFQAEKEARQKQQEMN